MTTRAREFPIAMLLLAACATGGGARTAAPGAPPPTAAAAAPGPAHPAGAVAQPRELTPRAQRLFEEAVAAAEEQKRLRVPADWEVLEQRWRAVAEAEPIPEAFFNVGVALERRGRVDEARAAYRRALEIEPRFSPAAVNLALLDEPADPRQAAQSWSELMRRFPDDAVPRARLAAIYDSAGQHDDAWALAREALLRDPRSVGAYEVMMRVALQRGRLDLAQLLALKARKVDGEDPAIVSFVGDVLSRQEEDAAAVAQWKKAVAMQDNFLPARYALLSNALAKQHWEGVVEQAQAILRTAPGDARVRVVLGIAYRHLGRPDEALAAYDEAERAGGDKVPEVHLDRAVLLIESKKQCEPALAELRRYMAAAGPAVASDGPAPRLQRECEQVVLASRQAADAARETRAQAAHEAAGGGAAPHETKAAGADGDPAPVPSGTTPPGGEEKGTAVPTR